MKFLKFKDLLMLVFPFAFIVMFCIKARYPSLNGDSVTLIGFPYPYRREALGSSFSYAWYLKGLLINLFFYGLIAYVFFSFFWHKIKSRALKTIFNSIIWVLFFISISIPLIFLEGQTVQWDYDFPNEWLGEIEFIY